MVRLCLYVQVVQEAFTALLGHRRAEALEKFKLELAASGHPSTSAADGASSKNVSTEGFAEAHRRCTESALKAFDKAAAGKGRSSRKRYTLSADFLALLF